MPTGERFRLFWIQSVSGIAGGHFKGQFLATLFSVSGIAGGHFKGQFSDTNINGR